MLEEWVYGTGLPANAIESDLTAFASVDAEIARCADVGRFRATAAKRATWTAAEQQGFLRALPEDLSALQLGALNSELSLAQSGNNEIEFLWLAAAMRNSYDPAVPLVREFLSRVGRNKLSNHCLPH